MAHCPAVGLCTPASPQEINAAKVLRRVNVNYLWCFGETDLSCCEVKEMDSPVDDCAHANCFERLYFFLYGAILSGSPFE